MCVKSTGKPVTFAAYATESEARAVCSMLAAVGFPAIVRGPEGTP